MTSGLTSLLCIAFSEFAKKFQRSLTAYPNLQSSIDFGCMPVESRIFGQKSIAWAPTLLKIEDQTFYFECYRHSTGLWYTFSNLLSNF